jgi:hypothetical protein
LILLDESVFRLLQDGHELLFCQVVQGGHHRQTPHELGYQPEFHQILGFDLTQNLTQSPVLFGLDGRAKSDFALARPTRNHLVEPHEGPTAYEQDVGRVHLHVFLLRVFLGSAWSYADFGAFQDLEKPLLNPFPRDISGCRWILALSRNLIDLIDVNDALLGPFHIVIGSGQEVLHNRLHILAHVARFGQGGGVSHGKRDLQEPRQRLRQQRLPRAGWTDEKNVGLLHLDRFFAVAQPNALVVIVHRNREHLLRVLLANHVGIQEALDRGRRRNALFRARAVVLKPFLCDDVIAQANALIADVHRRPGYQLLDLALALPAERARKIHIATVSTTHFDHPSAAWARAQRPCCEQRPTTRRGEPGPVTEAKTKKVLSHTAQTLLDGALVGMLLVGGLLSYRGMVRTQERLEADLSEAEAHRELSTFQDLETARNLYLPWTTRRAGDGRAWTGLSETMRLLISVHGLPLPLSDVRNAIDRAQQEGASAASLILPSAFWLLQSGRPAEARQSLAESMSGTSESWQTSLLRASTLAAENQLFEAEAALEALRETSKGHALVALELAAIHHRRDKASDASRDLRNLVDADPELRWPQAWAYLAAILAQRHGDLTAPLQLIDRLTAHAAENVTIAPRAKAHIAWAESELLLAAGELERARKRVDVALGFDPQFPPYLDLSARIFLRQEQPTDALIDLKNAASGKTRFEGIVWNYAKARSEMKEPSALSIAQSLTESIPGPQSAKLDLLSAKHFYLRRDLTRAKAAFDRASRFPDGSAALIGLARVALDEERIKTGDADYDRVLRMVTGVSTDAHLAPELELLLARIDVARKDLPGTQEHLEQALQRAIETDRSVAELLELHNEAYLILAPLKRGALAKKARRQQLRWKRRKETFIDELRQKVCPEAQKAERPWCSAGASTQG